MSLEIPPHTARVLPLHKEFSLGGRDRNAGVFVLSDHQQVMFAAHMDKSGDNVYSLEHLDPWRIEEGFQIPVTFH